MTTWVATTLPGPATSWRPPRAFWLRAPRTGDRAEAGEPVGAAALGFARRAVAEGIARARGRRLFGRALADFQLTQARLGEMTLAVDASALLVYRAAWTRDTLGRRVTREASMAKLFATESAQQVVDAAVQLFGGLGVVRGVTVERQPRPITVHSLDYDIVAKYHTEEDLAYDGQTVMHEYSHGVTNRLVGGGASTCVAGGGGASGLGAGARPVISAMRASASACA